MLVLSVIGCLKLFDQAFIVSGGGGGPNYSTLTPVLYLYQVAIQDVDFGYAAALGVALFLVIFTATLVQRLLFGKAEVGADDRRSTQARARPESQRPVPPRTRSRERIRVVVVYTLLVGVALLFFTPFFWSVSTSLKTLPESVAGFDLLPDDPSLARLPRGADRVQLRALRGEQRLPRRDAHAHERPARVDRRLRVRAPALPRPRGALHARARDADDPRPAPARARVPDARPTGG